MEQLRYPIGPFKRQDSLDEQTRFGYIASLEEAPGRLREAVAGLSDSELDTPYRPEGWTVRQVVHHLADADLNGYIRTKQALTEKEPVIAPFDEEAWSELTDARTAPVALSLILHDQLHRRWTMLLRATPAADFARAYRHPANGLWTLDSALSFFAWHNLHHIAHITSLRERNGWNAERIIGD
nr:bacillithiol transferase BstA [Paenibacillus humicola]